MKTTENNKLIAEFMGGILSSVPNVINIPQTVGGARILCVKGSEMLPNGTYSVHRLNDLKYCSSWDWLMPVVNRIESMRSKKGNAFVFTIDMCNVNIDETNINILGFANKFDAVYTAVLEFINKYSNEQINKNN